LQIERNEPKIPSVIQICEISKLEFGRIDLQRGRFLFLHTLDPLLPVASGGFAASGISHYRGHRSIASASCRVVQTAQNLSLEAAYSFGI
jgi:hypothetical protein